MKQRGKTLDNKRFLEDAKKFIMTYDYHTHTTYSHGKGSIEENVRAAVNKGLEGVAITDHGPGHLTYGLKREDIPAMRDEVEKCKKLYSIDIFLGIEANIINSDNGLDISRQEFGLYDFVIAGYHYGVKGGYCLSNWFEDHIQGGGRSRVSGMRDTPSGKKLRILNTAMTINALYQNTLKILAHPGDKAQFDMMALAKACQETGTLMEISTWHKHLTTDELVMLKNTENLFVISSDAHVPSRVGDFELGLARALEAGIEPERIVNIAVK